MSTPNDNSLTFTGELAIDDQNMVAQANDPNKTDSHEEFTTSYLWTTWDAYELVTPPVVDYVANHFRDMDPATDDYHPEYDDGKVGTEMYGIRFPVQHAQWSSRVLSCEIVKVSLLQTVMVEVKKIEIKRYLFPRLSAAISSVSAYKLNESILTDDPSTTRTLLSNNIHVGQLGGVTVQINFAEQNLDHGQSSASRNAAEHLRYENSKYIWIMSATMGMFDPDTGEGKNIINPRGIAYTVTRWCSTVPQSGTPAVFIR